MSACCAKCGQPYSTFDYTSTTYAGIHVIVVFCRGCGAVQAILPRN